MLVATMTGLFTADDGSTHHVAIQVQVAADDDAFKSAEVSPDPVVFQGKKPRITFGKCVFDLDGVLVPALDVMPKNLVIGLGNSDGPLCKWLDGILVT